MFVTSEILQRTGACNEGQVWFAKHYPNGAELAELITHRHITKSFLHWGRKYLSPNEKEIELYDRVLENENNDTVLECEKTKNSKRTFYSKNINNCADIHRCEDIKDSFVVVSSNTVENSSQVFLSEFIYNSIKVLNSTNINQSTNIIESTYIVRSKNIYMSNLITRCSEIYRGVNLEDCFFCSDCSNLKHCFGCQGLSEGEYMIFNKQVAPEHFEIIRNQYLSIVDCLLIYVDYWPQDIIAANVPKVNRKFPHHYETMPSKFWKWTKTLPNYSDNVMFRLTCLPDFLTQ